MAYALKTCSQLFQAAGLATKGLDSDGSHTTPLRRQLVLPVAAALTIAFFYFNRIQTLFYDGVYVDLGMWAHLTYWPTAFHQEPSAYYPCLLDYFRNHLRPLFFLLVLPSAIIPTNHIDNVALIFAAQAFLIVLSASLAVLALPGPLPSRSVLAALLGIAFFFSAPTFAAVDYPHFETMFAPLVILLMLAVASGRNAIAGALCVLLVSIREDLGVHLFTIIAVLVGYEALFNKTPWPKLRFVLFLGVGALCYSVAASFIQHQLLHGGAGVVSDYVNDPLYAHVTREFLIRRLSLFFQLRGYLVFAVLATVFLAVFYRQAAYLLGYAAFTPFLLFNLLAVKEEAGTLATYHGFPFMLALIWPVLYEALRANLFERPMPESLLISSHEHRDGAGRALGAIIVATLLICLSTIILRPISMKAIYWRELPKTEKRLASLALMDFFHQNLHRKLDLRVSAAVAAIAGNEVSRGDVITVRRLTKAEPANGVIFQAGITGTAAINFAKVSHFDTVVRLGKSNIYVAFRGDKRDNIMTGLQEAMEGRVNLKEVSLPDVVARPPKK